MSSNLDSIDQERLTQVSRVVNVMFDELVTKAIADVKTLPETCRQSGDDSPLKDVWEEFKYQMQEGESVMIEFYEDVIQTICTRAVAKLEEERQKLLWLWSDGYFRWDDREEATQSDVEASVAREVYDRLCSVADSEALAVDPDEERDRERYEDDMAGSEGAE